MSLFLMLWTQTGRIFLTKNLKISKSFVLRILMVTAINTAWDTCSGRDALCFWVMQTLMIKDDF